MNNIICTPHVGYVTREEFELQFADVFNQILAFASGAPINVVNPEVLAKREQHTRSARSDRNKARSCRVSLHMRILIIGATGTIGQAVVAALENQHELILASRQEAHEKVDISDPQSIRALYNRVGKLDAVVVAAGAAAFRPLAELTDEDFALSVRSKLMGQVNVVRYGFDSVNDGGSFTITSGTLANEPMRNGSAASLVNGALNSFTRAAAHEAPRGIRVNAVAPPWITETLLAYKMDPEGGMPAVDVGRAYAAAVEGIQTGQIVSPVFSSRR